MTDNPPAGNFLLLEPAMAPSAEGASIAGLALMLPTGTGGRTSVVVGAAGGFYVLPVMVPGTVAGAVEVAVAGAGAGARRTEAGARRAVGAGSMGRDG